MLEVATVPLMILPLALLGSGEAKAVAACPFLLPCITAARPWPAVPPAAVGKDVVVPLPAAAAAAGTGSPPDEISEISLQHEEAGEPV